MPRPVKVLFVCLHGAAKSVVAAKHLERLAAVESIDVESSSAGLDPDQTIPSQVVAGLAADAIHVSEGAPVQATPALLAGADLVVSLGCNLTPISGDARVITWDDVPAVSDGYANARDAIVTRLQGLLDEIRALETPPASR